MTTGNHKGMYGLLIAAAVLAGGSIWFACSADDEFETNYELETLARPKLSSSIEIDNNTPQFFQGILLTHNIANFDYEPIMGDWTANHFTIEWSDGYTGNIGADSIRCVTWMYNVNLNEETYTLDFPYYYKQYNSELKYSCRWDYNNNLIITYKFKTNRYYWDSWSGKYNKNHEYGVDSVSHTYSLETVLEHVIDDYGNDTLQNKES